MSEEGPAPDASTGDEPHEGEKDKIDKFLTKNSVIGVTVDEHQEGVVVVSFKHGDHLYQGALLHVNTERGIPSCITFPKESLPASEENSSSQESSPLKQRHTYFPDVNSPNKPRVTLRRIIKPPARFKNSRMPVRLRNRPVLCLKCKAFCEEIKDKESRSKESPGDNLIANNDSNNGSTSSTSTVKVKKKKSPPTVLLGVTTRRGYAKSIELGFDDKKPSPSPPSPSLEKVSKIKNNDKNDLKVIELGPTTSPVPVLFDESALYERVGHLGHVENYWKRPLTDPELVINRKINTTGATIDEKQSFTNRTSAISSGFNNKTSLENPSYISKINQDNITKIIFKNISSQNQANASTTTTNNNGGNRQPPKLTPSSSTINDNKLNKNNDKYEAEEHDEDEFYQMPKLLATLPSEEDDTKEDLFEKSPAQNDLPPQLPPPVVVSRTILMKPHVESELDQSRSSTSSSQLKISIIKVSKPNSSLKIKTITTGGAEESKKVVIEKQPPFIIKNSSLSSLSDLNENSNSNTNGHCSGSIEDLANSSSSSSNSGENINNFISNNKSSKSDLVSANNIDDINHKKVNWGKNRFRKASTVPVRFRDDTFSTKNIFKFKNRREEDDNYFVDVEELDESDPVPDPVSSNKNHQDKDTYNTNSSSVKNKNYTTSSQSTYIQFGGPVQGNNKDKMAREFTYGKPDPNIPWIINRSTRLIPRSPRSLNDSSSSSSSVPINLPPRITTTKLVVHKVSSNSSSASSSVESTTTTTTTSTNNSYGSVIKIAMDPKNGYVVVPNNNNNNNNMAMMEDIKAIKKAKKIARKMRSTSSEPTSELYSSDLHQQNEANIEANDDNEELFKIKLKNSNDQSSTSTSRNIIGTSNSIQSPSNTSFSLQEESSLGMSNILYKDHSKIKLNMTTTTSVPAFIDTTPPSSDSYVTINNSCTRASLQQQSEVPSNSNSSNINDQEFEKKSEESFQQQQQMQFFSLPSPSSSSKKKKKEKKRKKEKLSPNENEKSDKKHHHHHVVISSSSSSSESVEYKETSTTTNEVKTSKKVRSNSFERTKKSKRNSSDHESDERRHSTESGSSKPIKQARMSTTTSLPSESIDDKNIQKSAGEKLCNKLLIRRLDQSSYVTCTNSSSSSSSSTNSISSSSSSSNNIDPGHTSNSNLHNVPSTSSGGGHEELQVNGDSNNEVIDDDEDEESAFPPNHSLDVDIDDCQDSVDFFTDNKNDTYKKGDIIWGKTDGCCWWPGKIMDIYIKDDPPDVGCCAKISWYNSTNMSYLKFANLARFFEEFNYKYIKNRGTRVYQAAVRDALIQAHKLNPGDLR